MCLSYQPICQGQNVLRISKRNARKWIEPRSSTTHDVGWDISRWFSSLDDREMDYSAHIRALPPWDCTGGEIDVLSQNLFVRLSLAAGSSKAASMHTRSMLAPSGCTVPELYYQKHRNKSAITKLSDGRKTCVLYLLWFGTKVT